MFKIGIGIYVLILQKYFMNVSKIGVVKKAVHVFIKKRKILNFQFFGYCNVCWYINPFNPEFLTRTLPCSKMDASLAAKSVTIVNQ